MTNTPSDFCVAWHSTMAQVNGTAWNALAQGVPTPFLEWEWLNRMEVSGSITPQTGWTPSHLTIHKGNRLVAAAPLYIKDHSEGEFIYSHLWGEVARKLEIPYYPYLVGMIPVTPVAGYRFLIAPDQDERELTQLMLKAIHQRSHQKGLSGISFLFVDDDWRRQITPHGYTPWLHQSYRWQNPGFTNFDGYLAQFKTNQRRNIKRERRRLANQQIQLAPLEDREITPNLLNLMYRYYADTNARYGPWGCKYLTPSFFTGLIEDYRHRLLLMAAIQDQNDTSPIGMALLVHKGSRLYGRYWGCDQPVDSLHFNTCFYGPIEWSIEKGMDTFDPGMGAHHKLRRGIPSVGVYSLHNFFTPVLQDIMAHHMTRFNHETQLAIRALNQHLPFARSARHPTP